VFVHKFVCRGTMEERIDAMIAEKSTLAAQLVGSGASGESLLTEMSREELLAFVALDINCAVG
jgi:non-specific serine/threonine protein kinase